MEATKEEKQKTDQEQKRRKKRDKITLKEN